MFRDFANHTDDAVAFNDFAFLTYLFYTGSNFHLFLPISYSSAGQIIRGKFQLHLVARKNSYMMNSHFAGYVSQNYFTARYFNFEHCVGQCFQNFTFNFDFIAHTTPSADKSRTNAIRAFPFTEARSILFKSSENLTAVSGNGYRVFKMGRIFAVHCNHRPAIIQLPDFISSRSQHGFYCEYHSRL